MAFLYEANQVPLQGVGGHACHWHSEVLTKAAPGEGDVQLTGHELGVVVKSLVEIAHAKQDDGIPIGFLDLQVLTSDWSHSNAFQRE